MNVTCLYSHSRNLGEKSRLMRDTGAKSRPICSARVQETQAYVAGQALSGAYLLHQMKFSREQVVSLSTSGSLVYFSSYGELRRLATKTTTIRLMKSHQHIGNRSPVHRLLSPSLFHFGLPLALPSSHIACAVCPHATKAFPNTRIRRERQPSRVDWHCKVQPPSPVSC